MVSPACVDMPCQFPTLDAVILTHIAMANTPAYSLYHGRDTGKDKQGKKIWTRIGAVWPNKSGKGLNLTWDYLPLGDGEEVFGQHGTEIAHRGELLQRGIPFAH